MNIAKDSGNTNNGLKITGKAHERNTFMKKLCTTLSVALILTFLFTLCISANTMGSVRDAEGGAGSMLDEAVTDIKDAVTGAVTDMDDMLDPDNGDPEAESDGIVDSKDTALDNDKNEGTKDTTNEKPAVTTDNRDTGKNENSAEDTTGTIDDMGLEEKGINPWAIVIAVIVVIAVLILIFVLIPKRRH